jgi:hypothetical protein
LKEENMKLKMPILHIALIALVAPSVAFAVLGGDVSSVQADRMQMKASVPVANKSANFTVHEMTTASGIAVREYASTTGTVFAVAWKGRGIPDLHQLMGTYFDTYTEAAKTAHGGRTHLVVRQDALVVRSGGHMRSFVGSAYVPGMLPQGVTEADIK